MGAFFSEMLILLSWVRRWTIYHDRSALSIATNGVTFNAALALEAWCWKVKYLNLLSVFSYAARIVFVVPQCLPTTDRAIELQGHSPDKTTIVYTARRLILWKVLDSWISWYF